MPDKLQCSKNQRGQMLVEVMVALSIILIGILAVFGLLSNSLSLNRVVADRYVGTYLAAEGIELVKNLIDKNAINNQPWNAGLNPGSYEMDYNDAALTPAPAVPTALLYDPVTGFYGYPPMSGNSTAFKRTIIIEWLGDGQEIKVTSRVNWTTRGGGNFTVDLEDRFYNWRS